MPGEIVTVGPRVLHCVERVDCPITKAPRTISNLPIVSTCECDSTTKRVSHRPLRRCSVCRRRRCCRCPGSRSIRGSKPQGSPIVRPSSSIVPGNDERNEFFHDEPTTATAIPIASSNGLRALSALRDRRSSENVFDDDRRARIADDENSIRRNFPSSTTVRYSNVDGKNEIAIDDTRQRNRSRWTSRVVHSGSPLSERHRRGDVFDDDDDDDDDGSSVAAIAIRLRDGCDGRGSVESPSRFGHSTLARKKFSAALSSQSDRPNANRCFNENYGNNYNDDDDDVNLLENFFSGDSIKNDETVEYFGDSAWKCELVSVDSSVCESTSSTDKTETKVTTDRRRRRNDGQRRERRSYLKIAFVMLLLMFGNNRFFRDNCGDAAGILVARIGFGAVTIGTAIGAVCGLPIDFDAGARAERSANLSHITGSSRKIQMYIKNRYLQILPDGSVNGSNDDNSEYTIFQRTSVSRGQLKIQGVATCIYLCMDACGLLYGSREYTDDCVFNETLEQHNYNTYSSVRWSTAKKTLYLGLNRWGQPRRVQAKGHNLGRLSAYARVLTRVAPSDRVEALQARMLGAHHNLRHRHNSHHHRNVQQLQCPDLPPQDKDARDKFRCRKRKKRKKRKRRCRKGEKPGNHCDAGEEHRGGNAETPMEGAPQSKRSCEGAASEELCRKQALDAPAKKRKSRIEQSSSSSSPTKIRVGNNDKQPPRNRGKDPGKKKSADLAKKPTLGDSPVDGEGSKRFNETSSVKRKRPMTKQRSALSTKKKMSGRVPRTSVTATRPTVPTMTLTSLLSSAGFATPSMGTTVASDVPAWRRTKISASTKNAVTSGDLKTSETETTRRGKVLSEIGSTTGEPTVVPATSGEIDDRSTFVTDSSVETSEETRSEEIVSDDDAANGFSGEYSTIMTTMDTTPPEGTKDFTSVTAPSLTASGEIDDPAIDETFDGSAASKIGQIGQIGRIGDESKITIGRRLAVFRNL